MEPYKVIDYRGYKIEIYFDDYFESPLEDWDMMATMSCLHRNYSLSTKDNKLTTAKEIEKQVEKKDVYSLPIYMYEHSGCTISTTPFQCRFDSGQLGYIWVTKERARKFLGKKRITKKVEKDIYNRMRRQIALIDSWISGEVYRFTILDEQGEEVDSCSGFIGDYEEQLLPDAQGQIDAFLVGK